MKPFLKWVGGKRWLAPRILDIIRSAGRMSGRLVYHEPFLGGGAVALAVASEASRAGVRIDMYLSDSHRELMMCWRQVILHPEAVVGHLHRMLTRWAIDSEGHRSLARADVASMSPEARAARVITLTRTSYGGLWREDRHGTFNVPWRGAPVSNVGAACSAVLDAADAMDRHRVYLDTCAWDPNQTLNRGPYDVWYLDPPYPRFDGRKTGAYSCLGTVPQGVSGVMGSTGLVAWNGALVMLSAPKHLEDEALALGADVETHTRRRRLRSTSGEGGSGGEILATWRPD